MLQSHFCAHQSSQRNPDAGTLSTAILDPFFAAADTLAQIDPFQQHRQFPGRDLLAPRRREGEFERAHLEPFVPQFRMQMFLSLRRVLCG